jgi:hypothetical protein
MKNDLPWFKHYNDARNHPKMKALRGRFGPTGYGHFWMFNEIISEAPDARLDLSRKINLLATAEELGLELPAFEEFLAFLSDPEIDLVNYSEGIVTTDQTQEDYAVVEGTRGRKRGMGKSSAEKRQNAAEDCENAAEKINRAEQSRAEENIRALCAREGPPVDKSEEERYSAYLLARAKKSRKVDNLDAYIASIAGKPDVIAAWRKYEAEEEAKPKPIPDPKLLCSKCGSPMKKLAGSPREAWCTGCKERSATWNEAWEYWEEDQVEPPEVVDEFQNTG